METNMRELIQSIDQAINVAEQMPKTERATRIEGLISVLKTIKSQALAGQLPPSQGIVTLGLAREVADWIDSLDSPLLKAVGKVEREYQKY
ncbi:MAG: hypothetical protein ACKPJT_09410 [Microcystis panniformis]|jgi:hypothetical protein|uniref:hypothetical protein n=1 Tax=Microcystis TaxID=1125 RepID=UPI00232C051B|nr:hypothetical protein [Microcystis aeruginosa]MDB9506830.1 hypothetical protein [Microcystis aeruginosa CS-338/01]